jgi:hypothetical protein
VLIDSAGNLIRSTSYGGSGEDRALGIAATHDGGFAIAGFTKSTNGDITSNHGDYDVWVIKTDYAGNITWQKTYGGTLNDQSAAIAASSDGGFIVSGFTASSDGDVSSIHGAEDLWLIKIDSAGSLLWQSTYGGSGVEKAYSIFEKANSNIIIAGSSYSNDGDVSGNHGGTDDWVLETTSTGSLVWEKSLGGSGFEEAYSVTPVDSNTLVVAGSTVSHDLDVSVNHGDFDVWIAALFASPVSGINSLSEEKQVIISPNPFTAKCTVDADLTGTLGIYDFTGREIFSASFNHHYILNTELAKGIYFIKLESEKEKIVKKIIID